MNEKIAIIDTDSMLYSAFMPNKVADPNTGEPMKVDGKFVYTPKTDDEIKDTLDGIMFHIFNEGAFTHYIGFVKGNDTTDDRLLINPEYKAQRTKEIPEKWEITKQHAIEKWGIIEVNDIEVDDAVRITNINIPNSHIVAIDKDLLWLEGENFNWRKNEWNTVTKSQEEEYLSRSLIIGDTVDNIKGLVGKGEKYCDRHYIKKVHEVLPYYIIDYGLEKGVEEFYKNFKCLYILEKSDKFTNIPTPISIEKIIKNNESETNESRSSSRKLPNS
jgi:hypothetical protein